MRNPLEHVCTSPDPRTIMHKKSQDIPNQTTVKNNKKNEINKTKTITYKLSPEINVPYFYYFLNIKNFLLNTVAHQSIGGLTQ